LCNAPPIYSPNAKVPEKKNRLQRAFAENEKKKNKTMAMRKKRSMYYQGGEVEAFNGGETVGLMIKHGAIGWWGCLLSW
jgi:hypothetical protein